MTFVINNSWLIPLLPLLAACVVGLFGARYLKQQSHWPIWIGVGASAVLSLTILFGMLGNTDFAHHDDHGAGEVHAGADHDHDHAHDQDEATEASGAAEHAAPALDVSAKLGEPVTEKYANTFVDRWFTWIAAGSEAEAGQAPGTESALSGYFEVAAGALIDPLTAVMLCVICGIGFLITIFSKGYMQGEAGYFRFFAYLGLFIFFMSCLVMGDNLIMLYLGWEGVGLSSYLLIGYYYDKPAAREAAKKAFLVNRVGDFGFAIGIMLTFWCFGTVSYFGDGNVGGAGFIEMFMNPAAYVPADRLWAVDWIPFALMLGAFGKSAQFPLYVWLPDAMEGPTPVSALIHAATMVTAGVYMIARLGTVFYSNEAALITIAVVGAFTAIFAGTIALRQFDLKKVFAYSTVSQLGFMFVGAACLAPVAAVFHLITHAFFKALLFLSSGVVMHAMAGHLDMRLMSGLKKDLPKTRILLLIGCLALAGFPLFSGFWSKDEISVYAGSSSLVLKIVLTTAAFFTAYYTFRLYFRVFEGPHMVPQGPADGHGQAPDTQHEAEAVASHAAVETGTVAESGVDVPHDPHTQGHAHDHGGHVHGGHGHGGPGHGDHHHNHEPLSMMLPLAVLALGAIFIGIINLPFGLGVPAHMLGTFLAQSPSFANAALVAAATFPEAAAANELAFGTTAGEVHVSALVIGSIVAVAGIALAWFMHLKDRGAADRLAEKLKGLSRLLEGKYWVDEIYQNGIVEPMRYLGRGLFLVDRFVVDGLVWLVSFIPQLTGFGLKLTLQRGYLQGYAVSMLLGIAVILLVIFL
ncbi:MAG: NADH-quinone oxidoreductase subunit L [Phycisphaerae bacterium]